MPFLVNDRMAIMSNQFYREFDMELWGGERKEDYRSAFQVDRDRLIHSQAFRQLQSKTQVFLSGEYDFYRTRLTHSMEVAQIGRSICNCLRVESPLLRDDFHIDESLVEAVCLAHDLGHSPFGHAGESSLHELMRNYGGFEGNAQTMRLLTEIFYVNEDGARGMTPTRALLDGVSKYKALLSEFTEFPKNHFLYDEQKRYREFIFGGDEIPKVLRNTESLNKLKSIECQIMDWADDVAYSLNDIADGVQAGFVGMDRIERWAGEIAMNKQWEKVLERLLEKMKSGRLESAFGARMGAFIRACRLRECENFMSGKSNRYRYELYIDNEELIQEVEFFKKLATDLIFKSPQLQQMVEFKARKILTGLWDAYYENYISSGRRSFRILPVYMGKLIDREENEAGKGRRICDWLSGMTDGLAMKTYKRLNDADFGSIRDLS